MVLHIRTVNNNHRVIKLNDSFKLNGKNQRLSESELMNKAKETGIILEGDNFRNFYLVK